MAKTIAQATVSYDRIPVLVVSYRDTDILLCQEIMHGGSLTDPYTLTWDDWQDWTSKPAVQVEWRVLVPAWYVERGELFEVFSRSKGNNPFQFVLATKDRGSAQLAVTMLTLYQKRSVQYGAAIHRLAYERGYGEPDPNWAQSFDSYPRLTDAQFLEAAKEECEWLDNITLVASLGQKVQPLQKVLRKWEGAS